ncbi:MAG: acyl-CoA dehydrogenase family protein [Acidimicrobiales bacterium]
MPESLSPELLKLQETVRAAAAGPLTELRERDDLDHRALRSEVTTISKGAGWFEMTRSPAMSKLDAGAELPTGALALAVVREALGEHNVAHLPGLFGSSPGLLATVDEPLRSLYLEPLLAGEKQGAFGFTEPDSAPRPTWGVVDGDDLVINGQKSYVTGGANADFVNTLVEVDEIGPAMVLIDATTPGVSITRRFESLDGSHHAAFQFTDVRVPRSHVIGPPGKGMSRAMDQVTQVRMGMAASCVGLTMYVVNLVEDYLKAPHRSGTPLGASERHRLRFGHMRIKAYAARSVLYRTARLADSGEKPVNETMAAKFIATETIGEVVDSAIQTVGGQALTDGHPLVGIHRRVRSLRLAEGTSDVLTMNIARGRLDLDVGRV